MEKALEDTKKLISDLIKKKVQFIVFAIVLLEILIIVQMNKCKILLIVIIFIKFKNKQLFEIQKKADKKKNYIKKGYLK